MGFQVGSDVGTTVGLVVGDIVGEEVAFDDGLVVVSYVGMEVSSQ